MRYDFDSPLNRRLTDSLKWRMYDEDVIPLWVADMDFVSPAPVIQALRERVEHGVFGYPAGILGDGKDLPAFRHLMVDRLAARYNWRVQPEELVFIPGVVTAFNLACHAFAAPGEKILLHDSNFRAVKRVADVVRIFERVSREVPSVLLMIGEGPERAAAQALARRLGVGERVRFLGQQESASEVTGMAHVFLLPSELESFGLSALEAMACGVPVVGSDAGGLPEVVKHAETGYLLPVGDVEGMAARTIEILKDDEHRREMGQAGRRRAAALFGADRVVSQYERLYERTLGG